MAEPLYKSDIVKVENRTAMTTMADDDNFVVHDTSEAKLKKISKTNAKTDLGVTQNTSDIATNATNISTNKIDIAKKIDKSCKDKIYRTLSIKIFSPI